MTTEDKLVALCSMLDPTTLILEIQSYISQYDYSVIRAIDATYDAYVREN